MSDNESVFDGGEGLSALVRKARRRTMWRNAGISLAVTLLIIAAGWFANLQLQYRSWENARREIESLKAISGPNQYLFDSRIHYGFLQGTAEYRTYKLVEGIPVDWGTETYEFSSFGGFSRPPGNYSNLSLPDPVMKQKDFHYYRPFNRNNGEREMMFYLPGVKYANYLDELPQLQDMDGRKLVELAVSFDTNYSAAQIKAMLPQGVHPRWYWVDTYSDRKRYEAFTMPDGERIDPFPASAGDVYGFGVHPDYNDVSEKDFLDALENGRLANQKYKQEFERIYDYLRADKEKPDAGDVRILGVVVTGTADSLKALQGQSYVRAAVLGAVVDRY